MISTEPGAKYPPAANRYHLYVSHYCPYAHGTMTARALNGLESVISISAVYPLLEDGWKFVSEAEFPGCIPDPYFKATKVKDIYLSVDPEYKGRFTVPILYDTVTKTIVSNDSEDIIIMFNESFKGFSKMAGQCIPPSTLTAASEDTFKWISEQVVPWWYKAGNATSQKEYEECYDTLFKGLDKVESALSKSRFLVGDSPTLSDIRLYPFILRHDPVFYVLFKTNLKSIAHDYPHIRDWLRRMYSLAGVAEATRMDHIKFGSYGNKTKNPSGFIPPYNGPHL